MNTIFKAYRYRITPDAEQAAMLARTFGCARYVYNWGLRVRTDAFYQRQERIGYTENSKLLTALKQESDKLWLAECSNVVLQQSLSNLDTAFKNFFQGRARYPTFKNRFGKQSARYTTSGFRWKNGKIWLAKMKTPLDICWSREFTGTPSGVTVSKDSSGRYFISILVKEEIQLLPVINKMIGIDLGLKHAAILSDGTKIPNPTFLRKAEKKLARAQRKLSRTQKDSKNREKARHQVALVHAKIADQRRDWQHKLTTQIVKENQVISVESLKVKNMVKNHCLAKSILDVGWGEMIRQLEYKTNWYGRTLVKIDQWYPSSKRCSACGYILDILKLNTREWTCPECGIAHDRDINAATNILSAGLSIIAGSDQLRLHEKLRWDTPNVKPVEFESVSCG